MANQTKKSTEDYFNASFGEHGYSKPLAQMLEVGAVVQGGTLFERLPIGTSVLGTSVLINYNNPVKAYHGTVQIATPNATGTAKVVQNGILKQIVFVTDNMEDTDSTKLEILDEKGYEIYDSGTVAESTTTIKVGTAVQDIPLYGTTSYVFTAEGTQSANKDIVFYVKYV